MLHLSPLINPDNMSCCPMSGFCTPNISFRLELVGTKSKGKNQTTERRVDQNISMQYKPLNNSVCDLLCTEARFIRLPHSKDRLTATRKQQQRLPDWLSSAHVPFDARIARILRAGTGHVSAVGKGILTSPKRHLRCPSAATVNLFHPCTPK